MALQTRLRELNPRHPTEVAGEFDARTDSPCCASAAATTATSRAASSRKTSCTVPTTPPWPKPPERRGLLAEGAKAMRGEGEKQKEEKVSETPARP